MNEALKDQLIDYSTHGKLEEIQELMRRFPTEIDLTFDDNFALKTAVANFDLSLLNFLLEQTAVLDYECQHDYPGLCLAIQNKSYSAISISRAILANNPSALTAQLITELTVLKQSGNMIAALPDNQSRSISMLSFAAFSNGVTFRHSYASARLENRCCLPIFAPRMKY